MAVLAGLAFCLSSCGSKNTEEAAAPPSGHARNVAHEFLSEKTKIEFPPGFEKIKAETITFHDLREYPLDVDTPPQQVLKLEGKKVAIHGFVIPLGSADMAYFSLTKVPYNECYFCYPPAANEQVIVYNPEPPEFNILKTPVRVTGRLEVGKKTDRNGFTTIYRMDAFSIEPISEDILPAETRKELDGIRAQVKEIMDLQRKLLNRNASAPQPAKDRPTK